MFPYEHTGIFYDTSLRCDHISIVAKLTEGFRGRAKTKNNRETFLLRFVSRSFPVVLPPCRFAALFTPLNVAKGGNHDGPVAGSTS